MRNIITTLRDKLGNKRINAATDNPAFQSIDEIFKAQLDGLTSPLDVPAFYACTRVIAQHITQMRMRFIYTNATGGSESASQLAGFTDLAKVANTPCPNMTYTAFWDGTIQDMLHYGIAYAGWHRIDGYVRLVRFPTEYVSEYPQPDGTTKYQVTTTKNGIASMPRIVPGDRILRFTYRSPNGKSIYKQHKDLFKRAYLIDQWTLGKLKNNNDIGLLIGGEFEDIESEEETATFIKTRISNADPIFIDTKDKLDHIDLRNKDIAKDILHEARDQLTKQICGIMGVPTHMISDNTGASNIGASVSEVTGYFLIGCLAPLAKGIEEELERVLIQPRKRTDLTINPVMRFNTDILRYQTRRQQAETLGRLVGSGILCPNEARRQIGYDTIEGGDCIYEPKQNTEIKLDNQ